MQLPPKPDITEPRQEKEKRATKDDKLATRPALAVGYHAPKRNTPEYYAMGLIDEILVQGKDTRLYQALVQKNGLTGDVTGGINSGLGNMFNINGPTLWDVSLFHDQDKSTDQILKVFDAEIQKIQTTPVDQATLDRALVKKRSWLYDKVEQTRRVRQGRPARLARAVRRRPQEDQRDRGRVPQSHAGADPEDRAEVPDARQPHDPGHRAQGRSGGSEEREVGGGP